MRPLAAFLALSCAACASTEAMPALDPCVLMTADATGPHAAAIAVSTDPVAIARLRMDEARTTADPGFDLLAEHALACAARQGPLTVDAQRLSVRLDLHAHRFEAARVTAAGLASRHDGWQDHLALADALLELGALDEAGRALDRADSLRPSALTADRAAELAWRRGDLPGALALYERAVRIASTGDRSLLVWELSQLGWLDALAGGDAAALDAALRLAPDDRGARYHRGLVRLARGDVEGARLDLLAAGPTVAATVARAEIDPDADVRAVQRQDRRGYAIWLIPRDPTAALVLLDAELADRRDAVTLMAHAWALHSAGRDGTDEARAALATGSIEPTVLWQGAQVLGDPLLYERALAMGPGLLPSQRAAVLR